MFTALAMVLAFIAVFHYTAIYSIVELWLLGAGVYVLVRYLGWRVFAAFTVHRGIFHSIVAALFFGFAATTLSYTVFDFSQLRSWTVGVFLTLGYVLHLVLDELYSIDICRAPAAFIMLLRNPQTYQNILDRFLPDATWFAW